MRFIPISGAFEFISIARKGVINTLLLGCLLLAPLFSTAQYSPYHQVNSLNSKLSSENIGAILQDKKGYLWVGTDDGLNRYDGYTFTVFKNIPGDSTSISNNEVYTLANDSIGNIWVGFSNGDLSYYSHYTERFNHIRSSTSGLAKNAVTKIIFDHSGRLWVAVAQNGLYYYDEKKRKFIKAGDLPDIHKGYQVSQTYFQNYNSIYDIYEDQQGVLWMATHDGLYRFYPKANIFESVRQKEIVPFEDRFDLFNKLLPGKEGFWMSSWGGGLTHYNPLTKEWKNFRYATGDPGTHNIIQGIEWKGEDQLWIASNDFGFGYFDIKNEKFTFLKTKQCQKILKDKTGSLWVSSSTEGLLQFDPLTLFSFQESPVTRSDNGEYYFTNGFYHDLVNHVLYYGVSFGDGLHVYDEINKKEVTYSFDVLPTSEKVLEIQHIYKDEQDTLWVLTRDYIYFFDQHDRSLRKFVQPFDKTIGKDKIITPDFYRLLRAANGDLWITSRDAGVYRYSFRDKQFTNYSTLGLNASQKNLARGIAEDTRGRIWIISNDHLMLFDYRDNSFHRIETYTNNSPDLSKVRFSDLTRSINGDIWITSDNGLYQYDHHQGSIKLTHWGTKDGLPSGKQSSVQTDSNGFVWFLTSSSLWCFNPDTKRIVTSIATRSHPSSASFYIDAANQIYLGTYKGYNAFSPAPEVNKASSPSLVITSFYVNNKRILIDSLDGAEIDLEYQLNSITIEFSALDFRNSSKNKYSFYLEGIESDWSAPTEQHLAHYGSLRPGRYAFKVRAATQDGIWSEPLEVQIHISPPFWLTWYFIGGVTLVIIYLFYLVSRWRTNAIRKETSILSTFEKKILETEMSMLRAQMNPHFIFNSLNSINRYILMADRETASFYLTKFSKLIRLILENSTKTRISLHQELTALKHYIDMELLRFDHSFSYNIEIDPDVDTLSIQFPPSIIQPYVENSIWHGFNRRSVYGALNIGIKKESASLLIITIEDNGVGRNAKKSNLETSSKKLHGMKITEDRLSILTKEGNPSSVEIIDLKNELGEPAGTKVIIRTTISESVKMVE